MSFTHVDVPVKQSAPKVPEFSEQELVEVAEMLTQGQNPSDGVAYAEQVGKRAPRDVAYYKGWYLRAAVAEHMGVSVKQIMVKTWSTDDGYCWALKLKG